MELRETRFADSTRRRTKIYNNVTNQYGGQTKTKDFKWGTTNTKNVESTHNYLVTNSRNILNLYKVESCVCHKDQNFQ